MNRFLNPEKIDKLEILIGNAHSAIKCMKAMKKNNPRADVHDFINQYEQSMSKIIAIHEDASKEYQEWKDAEFGDEMRQERYAKRNRVKEPDVY